MMIHCLLLGAFVSLIGLSYPQTAMIRDGKLTCSYVAIVAIHETTTLCGLHKFL